MSPIAPDIFAAPRKPIVRSRRGTAVSMARAEDERTAALAEVSDAEASVARLAEAVRGEADDDAAEWDPQAMDRAEREIVRLELTFLDLGMLASLYTAHRIALALAPSPARPIRALVPWAIVIVLALFLLLAYIALRWGPAPVRFHQG